MPYPKKYQGELVPIKIPVFNSERGYVCSFLNANGTTFESGFAGHTTEKSCWVCCTAHNERVGYTKKQVDKIINKINDERKAKKAKKGKAKKDGKKDIKKAGAKSGKGKKKSKAKTKDNRVSDKVKGRNKK